MTSDYLEKAQRHEARAARFRAIGNERLAKEREAKAKRLRAKDEQERRNEQRLTALERAVINLMMQRIVDDLLGPVLSDKIEENQSRTDPFTGCPRS
ncbi:hypothetical protein [Methylobacterium indicum]|uniref:Uncharacterized protein n=1 Tax=Methylobacterium indicum TaxID=1775910 RepID=A0A8H8X136_9HYPH|nr:hypothetical protein [Methylobacterium indicum]BCM87759.1 hypothetical protein mvi_62200 [Methylobacterium indicum]